MVITTNKQPNTRLIRICTSACNFVVLYSVRTGIKACENAPSANSRLKKFGIRKATTKVSKSLPAPKTLSRTMSRTKPKTRDNIVIALTIKVDRQSAIVFTTEKNVVIVIKKKNVWVEYY